MLGDSRRRRRQNAGRSGEREPSRDTLRPAPLSRLRRGPARPAAIAVEGAPGGGGPQGPRVVAKGRGAVAEQILALAFAAGVRVREDADLVEILEAIEIDADIPAHALAAVAEILTYVYRANGRAHPQHGPARAVENPR